MRHTTIFRLSGAVGAALLGLSLAQPAAAQGELEEIIVTAQKREQSLQDVPVAVTAITSVELADRTISNLFGIAESTPNLQIGTSGTGSQNAIVFIRGIGQTSNRVNLDQGVGTYVDGIYRTNVWGGLFDLLDVGANRSTERPAGHPVRQECAGWSDQTLFRGARALTRLGEKPPSRRVAITASMQGHR